MLIMKKILNVDGQKKTHIEKKTHLSHTSRTYSLYLCIDTGRKYSEQNKYGLHFTNW